MGQATINVTGIVEEIVPDMSKIEPVGQVVTITVHGDATEMFSIGTFKNTSTTGEVMRLILDGVSTDNEEVIVNNAVIDVVTGTDGANVEMQPNVAAHIRGSVELLNPAPTDTGATHQAAITVDWHWEDADGNVI